MRSRSVVVVGCSRGIGLGVMRHLADNPVCAALVGVVRKSEDEQRLKELFLGFPNVLIVRGDVTDKVSMDNVARVVTSAGIVPDLLLCNAGVLTEPVGVLDIQDSDMRLSFDVNVLGPLHTMTAFLPLMRNVEGAVIVNVSSGWGLRGAVGQSTYCASKHALEGLMKCVADETAADPVSVVTVRPGMVFTEMLAVAEGSVERARENGVPVDLFVPQFCEKIFSIGKDSSGTHVDCGLRK